MKVKIGAFDYDLQEVPAVIDKDGQACFGLCEHAEFEITIEESSGNPRKLNSYLHEVLEALNALYGFDLTHPQVIGISGSLAQVLQENPELTNRLTQLASPKVDDWEWDAADNISREMRSPDSMLDKLEEEKKCKI